MVCFIPSSCRWAYSADCDGGNVRRMWWHLGPAHWTSICPCIPQLVLFPQSLVDDLVHERSGTHWCLQYLHPLWIPHVGSQLSHSHWTHGCTIPHSGLACVLSDPACVYNFSPRLSYNVRVLSGTSDEKYTSSRYAKRCSSGLSSLDASSNGSWIAKLNSNGMRGSPCSPPSTWMMRCNTPPSSSHT